MQDFGFVAKADDPTKKHGRNCDISGKNKMIRTIRDKHRFCAKTIYDNIDKAARSGVSYVVEPGGSIRDDLVIEAANRHGMVMCFTGMRLFHH